MSDNAEELGLHESGTAVRARASGSRDTKWYEGGTSLCGPD